MSAAKPEASLRENMAAGDQSLRDRRALVAIDLGAESCRVSLLRWLAHGPSIQLIHRFPNRAVEFGGELRWNLQEIQRELVLGLVRCAETASEGIRSIGVDGWAVDYVRLNPEGEPVGDPFCYRDPRTLAAEIAAHERLSAEHMRELTGVQIQRINTAYQLLADHPSHRTLPWLNLPEYILHWLGGRPVAERTNATHTQLVGLDGNWSEQVFNGLELLQSAAPELVDAGTDLGRLSGRLAELPAFHDTRLIAPACHDTASAVAAIPDQRDDWAYISSGTWSLVGTLLDAPLNTPEACEANFTNLAAAGGKVCFHKGVNGLWILRQCLESWNEAGARLSIVDVVEFAAAHPDRGYALEVDDPELLLQGNMPERINAQLRRRGLPEMSPEPEHAGELASFLFHSLAARYAEVLHRIAQLTGREFRRLYIMGGGSQNALLNRLTSRATGLPVHAAAPESSTLGNFAIQLASLEALPTGIARYGEICEWAKRLTQASVRKA